MTGLHRLFVYGTLMRGEANAHMMTAARFVSPACTVAAYRLLLREGYPALVPGGGAGTAAVRGELYLVDEPQLAALDDFEGHPGLFRRQPVDLAGGGQAQAYLFAEPGRLVHAPLLADGDWRRRPRGRSPAAPRR